MYIYIYNNIYTLLYIIQRYRNKSIFLVYELFLNFFVNLCAKYFKEPIHYLVS